MGAIYKPRYRAPDGTLREQRYWWARYRMHGQTVRQSTNQEDKRKALDYLKSQEGSRCAWRERSG